MKFTSILFLFIAFSPLSFAQESGDIGLAGKESSDHLWHVDIGYGKLYTGVDKVTEKIISKDEEYTVLLFELIGL